MLRGNGLRLFGKRAEVVTLRRRAQHFLQLLLAPGFRVKQAGGAFAVMAPQGSGSAVLHGDRIFAQHVPQEIKAGIDHRRAAVRRFGDGAAEEGAQHGFRNAVGIGHGFFGQLGCIHPAGKHQPRRQRGDAEADDHGDEDKSCRQFFHRSFLLTDGLKHRAVLRFVPDEPGKVLVDELLKIKLLHCHTTPSACPAGSCSPGLSGNEPCRPTTAARLRSLSASAPCNTAAGRPPGIWRAGP